MADAGAAVVIPDARARRRRGCARRSRRCSPTRRGSSAMARGGARARAARRGRARSPTRCSRAAARAGRRRRDGSARPWAGRRLHFVGIGGAGMSGLALVGAAPGRRGARLRPRRVALHARAARGRDRAAIGHDAAHAEAGVELVVSTAIPDDAPELVAARGRGRAGAAPRASCWPRSRALRRVIAVAGTHGKTTTTAMIAARARGLRPRPRLPGRRRAARPATAPRTRAGARASGWCVEADESDRSFLALAPEVAVVTNVELDHHTTYSSELELEQAFDAFLERAARGRHGGRVGGAPVRAPPAGPHASRTASATERDARARATRARRAPAARFDRCASDGRASATVELPVPGEHNVLNALAALGGRRGRRLRRSRDGGARACELPPGGRRFEPAGERDGALDLRRLRPPPDRGRGDPAGRARARAASGWSPSSSRTSTRARCTCTASSAARSRSPTRSWCSTSTRPASGPRASSPGVTGKLVADAAADRAGGRPVWWLPDDRGGRAGARPAARRRRPAGHARRRRRRPPRRRCWWRRGERARRAARRASSATTRSRG